MGKAIKNTASSIKFFLEVIVFDKMWIKAKLYLRVIFACRSVENKQSNCKVNNLLRIHNQYVIDSLQTFRIVEESIAEGYLLGYSTL